MTDKNIIFVVGATKTGASPLVQMLNAHPDIFVLYESSIGYFPLKKYTGRFISAYPDVRSLFSYGAVPEDFFCSLQKFLAEKGHNFKVVGTSAPEFAMNAYPLDALRLYPLIFAVRDIRTWLAKDSVIEHYFTDNDIVHAAIDYTASFIKSFMLDKVLHVRMEDVIHRNDDVIETLAKFLNLDIRPHLNEWWKTTFPDSHPKSAQKWREGHTVSAHFGPRGVEDTEVTLARHPFWNELLPIFDAYYGNPSAKIPKETILADLEKLQALKRLSPIKLEEAYERHKSVKLRPEGYLKKRITTGVVSEMRRIKSMIKVLASELFA